jgi:hypothetical protein
MIFRKKQFAMRIFLYVVFYLSIGFAQNVLAKDVFPMAQGLHEWKLPAGKVILVVGTYQDTTTFKRSYNFYFQAKNSEAWNQVPILRKPDDLQFTWSSASGGDVTLADGIVSAQASGVYFIRADKRADNGWYEKGESVVTWFKFSEADNDHPDDPPYSLRPVFTRHYSKTLNLSVEDILNKESALKPVK